MGNVLLHTRERDAEPPPWPHIVCEGEVGQAGYVWHPDAKRRGCFTGRTEAPAELVASVLDGRAVDRVWALRSLIVGDETGARWPGVVVVLWRCQCPGCGRCHLTTARLFRRVALAIEPSALDALREADPPMRALLDVDVSQVRSQRYHLAHPQRQSLDVSCPRCGAPPGAACARVRPSGLPVRATHEETGRAQIAWAYDFAARRLHPIDAPRNRRRIVA